MLPDRLSHQPFESSEALLELRFLEHPELRVHHRGQSRRDPVAQATVEGVTLFTIDSLVAQYPGPIRQSERNPRLSQ
jgi:PIN domain nuclease of toxin-antitoxin system